MHGVKFSPTPIEAEERLLIFRGELRAVAEGHAGGRAGADVEHGAEVVGVPFGAFARTVAPAVFGAAGREAHTGGAIPRRVEIVFHVGVVGEQFAVVIDRRVENVAVTGGMRREIFSVERHAINDAAGSEHFAHETTAIRHPREDVILAPHERDFRGAERGGLGAVAGDEEERLAIGRGHDRVNAVIAARVHLAEEFHLVERVVVLRGGDAVEAAGDFVFVIVHRDVEAVVHPQQSVRGADGGGDFLNRRGIKRLAGRGRREAEEAAVLIARDDAALGVGAEIDPRALFGAGHGVEQLDLEILQRLDARDGRGLVFIDGEAGAGPRGGGLLGVLARGCGGVGVGGKQREREQNGGGAEQFFHKAWRH